MPQVWKPERNRINVLRTLVSFFIYEAGFTCRGYKYISVTNHNQIFCLPPELWCLQKLSNDWLNFEWTALLCVYETNVLWRFLWLHSTASKQLFRGLPHSFRWPFNGEEEHFFVYTSNLTYFIRCLYIPSSPCFNSINHTWNSWSIWVFWKRQRGDSWFCWCMWPSSILSCFLSVARFFGTLDSRFMPIMLIFKLGLHQRFRKNALQHFSGMINPDANFVWIATWGTIK